MHTPTNARIIRGDTKLPPLLKAKLFRVNSGNMLKSVPLGRPLEIDDMPMLVVVLVTKIFHRPIAEEMQSFEQSDEKLEAAF